MSRNGLPLKDKRSLLVIRKTEEVGEAEKEEFNKKTVWLFFDTTIQGWAISFHILPTLVIETHHQNRIEIYLNWLFWLVGIAYGIKER